MSSTSPRTTSERSGSVLPFVVTAVVVAVPATLFATFLAIGACIGSEGKGVDPDSARGQACDIPGLGAWPYTLLVSTVALLLALRFLVRNRPTGVPAVVAAMLPAVVVFVVPAALRLLPR